MSVVPYIKDIRQTRDRVIAEIMEVIGDKFNIYMGVFGRHIPFCADIGHLMETTRMGTHIKTTEVVPNKAYNGQLTPTNFEEMPVESLVALLENLKTMFKK